MLLETFLGSVTFLADLEAPFYHHKLSPLVCTRVYAGTCPGHVER